MALLVGNSGQKDEICTDRKHIGACAGSVLMVVCKEDGKGTLGMMEIFCFLNKMTVTRKHTFVKIHPNSHFKWVYFVIFKSHLIKTK